MFLHRRDRTVEIHDGFNQFDVATSNGDGGEVVQTLNIKSAFAGVMKTWARVVEV